ncbi:MAG: hypothetical protein QNJ31_01745 [Candidatus Caenarcaniphilales bacterium]|nr:hypothetical protein [Candidatus Caenarcaniphilales bacterium]
MTNFPVTGGYWQDPQKSTQAFDSPFRYFPSLNNSSLSFNGNNWLNTNNFYPQEFSKQNNQFINWNGSGHNHHYISSDFTIPWERINTSQSTNTNRNVRITIKRNNHQNDSNTFFLEDLVGGGDKDFNDMVLQTKGLRNNRSEAGTFTAPANGKVSVDYLFDGGKHKGELALVSLEGLENLDRDSDEFRREVVKRAKSNSEKGRVVVSDPEMGARLDSGRLGKRKNFDKGDYKGNKEFQFKPNDKLVMVYLGDDKFSDIKPNRLPKDIFFSTGSKDGFEHFKQSQNINLPDNPNAALNKLNDALGKSKSVKEMFTV